MRSPFDFALRPSRGAAATDRWFLVACTVAFGASVALTIRLCDPTCCSSVMMSGGWTLSAVWTRGAGESWPGKLASFLAMWTVMMVAMMLPCVIPTLRRHRHALERAGAVRAGASTLLVSSGYFAVWAAIGSVIYPIGAAIASAALHSPAVSRVVPALSAIVLVLTGAFQLTPWKSRALLRCRSESSCNCAASPWRHGVALGVHCSWCCFGLVAALLVLGAMDIGAMAIVATATIAERIAPAPLRIARCTGALAIAAGALMTARIVLAS
jgi:predicted metal-binding membrane protein